MSLLSSAITDSNAISQSAKQPGAGAKSDPDIDLQLIQAIRKQSPTEYLQFCQRYSNTIIAFAMSHIASEPDCQEILNDVLLTVWSNATSYAGRSSVRTWVLGITHHKAMDYLRKHQRNNRLNEMYGEELQTADHEISAESAIEALDSARLVRDSLQMLSQNHREVLHLAYYEDLSCSEIAQILECPSGTVKTRLMHAKEKMKSLLTRRENFDV